MIGDTTFSFIRSYNLNVPDFMMDVFQESTIAYYSADFYSYKKTFEQPFVRLMPSDDRLWLLAAMAASLWAGKKWGETVFKGLDHVGLGHATKALLTGARGVAKIGIAPISFFFPLFNNLLNRVVNTFPARASAIGDISEMTGLLLAAVTTTNRKS